jgi:plasmid stabilization system protein ParE
VRLCYTTRAAADLTEIANYLVSRSPVGAQRVRAAILATLRTIIDLPHAGRLQAVDAVRKIVVRRYPYVVYYRVDEDAEEIVVLTIQHTAQQRAFRDA